MDTESGVGVRRQRSGEEVERLVIGDRSSQVPRQEYCRLHGIGLSTLERYLQQWHRRQSQGGKESPAEGQTLPAELPRVEKVIACTPEQCCCSNCGAASYSRAVTSRPMKRRSMCRWLCGLRP
ncbi:MAG: hypothetical protein ACYCPO_01780 [Acidobacteriaceae bacterium]